MIDCDEILIPPPFGVDCYGRVYRNSPMPRNPAPLGTVQEESDRLDEEMRLLTQTVANMFRTSNAGAVPRRVSDVGTSLSLGLPSSGD